MRGGLVPRVRAKRSTAVDTADVEISAAERTGNGPANTPAPRFYTVDALRGVAAVAVVLFHLFRNSPQTDVLTAMTPGFLAGIFDYSRSGVAIFFVISGFVITYSTRSLLWHPRGAGRFIVRRQVRLDPPYYVVIAVALGVNALQMLIPSLETRHYDVIDVLANLVYLQGIFDRTPVLAVAWTLCLEVQFYLFVLFVGLIFHRIRPRAAFRANQVALGIAGVVSLVVYAMAANNDAWFIGQWWMYFTGVVLCWRFEGKLPRSITIVWLAAVFVMCAAGSVGWIPGFDPWAGQWVAWATGVLFFGLIETRNLARRPPSVFLWLGGISYSLYLVHLPVIDVVMGAGYKLTGDSRIGAVACWVGGAVCSLIAAAILHRFVEAPSIRLARRLTTLHATAL